MRAEGISGYASRLEIGLDGPLKNIGNLTKIQLGQFDFDANAGIMVGTLYAVAGDEMQEKLRLSPRGTKLQFRVRLGDTDHFMTGEGYLVGWAGFNIGVNDPLTITFAIRTIGFPTLERIEEQSLDKTGT
jgi:hypothetical protein